MRQTLGIFTLALSLVFSTADACTTVAIPHSAGKVMAKSYDWSQGHGLVLVNKRRVLKQSLNFRPDEVPVKWTSQYGSVTFNQHGREFPLGGINEKGLAIEIMWLDSSEYPDADTRGTVNELQWIQYQLDNYASVREVYAHRDDLRVLPIYAKVHYLACDPSGECASFEYVNKKMVSKTQETMPVTTLTNDTYEDSLRYLERHEGFGGSTPVPQSTASLDRFVRASALAKAFNSTTQEEVPYAFEILDSVGPTQSSKFHIVYETKTRQLHFRTRDHFRIKSIDTDRFDYSCEGTKTVMMDMSAKIEGPITDQFVAYTPEANKAVIEESLKLVGGALPEAVVKAWIAYPETTRCEPRQ